MDSCQVFLRSLKMRFVNFSKIKVCQNTTLPQGLVDYKLYLRVANFFKSLNFCQKLDVGFLFVLLKITVSFSVSVRVHCHLHLLFFVYAFALCSANF